MTFNRRCSELDLLSHQLIAAYSRVFHAELPEEILAANFELDRVHRCLSAHRVGCSTCKENSEINDPLIAASSQVYSKSLSSRGPTPTTLMNAKLFELTEYKPGKPKL